MKKIIISIIFMFIIILLLNINKNNNEDNLKTIKVSEVTHSIFYAPFYVAIENGYFKENGINIDLILTNGSDNVAVSLLSGDSDVGLAGVESAMFVYLGGEKDYLKVFSGLTKKDGQFIIGRNKNFNWDQLKGKEILVGRSTGMPALSFLKALENHNIKKEDVIINYSIDFSELSGAFIGGVGDYVNLFEPIASKLEENNQGYSLESVGASSILIPYTAFYSRKSYIDNNKDLLTKFNNSINKGLDYIKNNSDDAIANLLKNQFNDIDKEMIIKIINKYKEADVWLNNTYIDEELYNNLNSLLKDNNIIKESIPYNNIIYNLYE